MQQRGEGCRPDAPDVDGLAEYGHVIVLPEGEALRRQLSAFTITRGSVDPAEWCTLPSGLSD